MSDTKKLFLLDAMALIYRAYFALNKNPRINSKGLNTSAILGFANTLLDLLKKENPSHIGIAFDTMAPTVRHEEFVEYKANRESLPEDIAISLPYIRKLIEGFRIPILEMDGYEADDVIGTLAKHAEKNGFTTYMVTPDKDFGQLISDNIFMYKPPRGGNGPEILGVKEICEKFSIKKPEQLIDILGLWGDASDNIPGIPGIGEKRSKELVVEFGSLENVIANSDKLKGKLKENVENFAEQGLQSKMLATIILDVPIPFDAETLLRQEPDKALLTELFNELEFRNYARRVFDNRPAIVDKKESGGPPDLFSSLPPEEQPQSNRENITTTKHNYRLVSDEKGRKNLISMLVKTGSFCFDTETTGLEVHTSDIIGIAFSIKESEAWYVTIPDENPGGVIEEFRGIFENEKLEKTGQNLKFDIAMLGKYGIEVKGKLFDTMIAHYLIQPELRHNMDYLAETYLNYTPVSIESLIGKKGRKQLSMKSVDIETLREYAGEDADITLRLRNILKKEIISSGAKDLFENIELPLITVLADMENTGVKVDIPVLKELSEQLGKDIQEVKISIQEMAGESFNISSPKQLGIILFEKLKISDKPKRTKSGQYSTGEDILLKLENKHPIVRQMLDYRSLTKLKSTYVDALPALINPVTGRIHTSYNQAVTSTGRLSSTNPNLQNIPIRTERGREIRKAFVPADDGHILLAADYSQIELRIMASLSEDEGMMEAFRKGLDIHISTAASIYDVDIEAVSKDMRRNAKTVNFGIIYGISAFGLSQQLDINRREASDIIKEYFLQFPGIKSYMESQVKSAREKGYVETIMKRRRYLRDINSSNAVVRGFAERNAINAPVQGSSADMIKIAMIDIHNDMKDKDLNSNMIMQVHDELVFDVRKDELEVLSGIVRERMINAIPLKVPVEIDINTGFNWLEAH